MQKLKLLPSLKEKKRYLVYRVISQQAFPDPVQPILDHLRHALGVFDSAKAGIQHLGYNKDTRKGILRATTTHTDKVKAALLLLTTIKQTPVIIKTEMTTGLLNKAKAMANQKGDTT